MSNTKHPANSKHTASPILANPIVIAGDQLEQFVITALETGLVGGGGEPHATSGQNPYPPELHSV